jgi:hypothetical protein
MMLLKYDQDEIAFNMCGSEDTGNAAMGPDAPLVRNRNTGTHSHDNPNPEYDKNHIESINDDDQEEDKVPLLEFHHLDRPRVYIGNSMGALVGLLAQRAYNGTIRDTQPNVAECTVGESQDSAHPCHHSPKNGSVSPESALLFHKLALLAPCIQVADVSWYAQPLLMVLANTLPTSWLRSAIVTFQTLNFAHLSGSDGEGGSKIDANEVYSVVNNDHNKHIQLHSPMKLTHNLLFNYYWETMRWLASKQLLVGGVSLRFLHALSEACNRLLTPVWHSHSILHATDILLIRAEVDTLVDNKAIESFYHMLLSAQKRQDDDKSHDGNNMGNNADDNEDGMKRNAKHAYRGYKVIANSYHELWGETDRVWQELKKELVEFAER